MVRCGGERTGKVRAVSGPERRGVSGWVCLRRWVALWASVESAGNLAPPAPSPSLFEVLAGFER